MARIGKDALQLTASLVTMHTIGTNVQGTFIEATLTNHDTVDRLVDLHFVPTGGSASNANKIIGLQTGQNALKAGEMRTYQWVPYLATGDFIQAKADVTLKVTLKLSILEEAV
ncbi:hypothetical protein MYX75_01085 [Acidobacteria bacterium AH-259-A15]|nr:hypothetical protein [Acidobacteria bacterium AH-259-A15]